MHVLRGGRGSESAGVHTYIVDKNGRQVPQGESGELWVAGWQVGLGYLNRPDKTAEVFIPNPFEKEPEFARIYRTGDIVRQRADGKIEYLGRRDGQVKIRGFRIELKEVEAVIREFTGIRDVTVQAFDEPGAGGGKFLAAYIVSDKEIDIQELDAFIADKKPPYMVPAVTMQIEAIPLNVNQKVDVKALPPSECPGRGTGGPCKGYGWNRRLRPYRASLLQWPILPQRPQASNGTVQEIRHRA